MCTVVLHWAASALCVQRPNWRSEATRVVAISAFGGAMTISRLSLAVWHVAGTRDLVVFDAFAVQVALCQVLAVIGATLVLIGPPLTFLSATSPLPLRPEPCQLLLPFLRTAYRKSRSPQLCSEDFLASMRVLDAMMASRSWYNAFGILSTCGIFLRQLAS